MINAFSSKELSDLTEKANGIVINVGGYVYSAWDKMGAVSYKKGDDPFTLIDIEAEKKLRSELSRLLPDAGFFVEEGENDIKSGYNWVIDPIDQTRNFVGKIPLFFVQVALLKGKTPVLGIIYNPISNQLFSASSGNGTFINGIKITTTGGVALEKAVVDIDLGGRDIASAKIRVLAELLNKAYRVRITGGAYSTYLLTGASAAYIVLNQTTKLVDQAPRLILFKEADFNVEQFQQNGYDIILASTQPLFIEIKNIIINNLK